MSLAYMKSQAKKVDLRSAFQPAITALEYSIQTTKEQLETMARVANNTSAKKQAQRVHNILSKNTKQQATMSIQTFTFCILLIDICSLADVTKGIRSRPALHTL